MGMGYAGAVAEVISTDGIRSICPDEYDAFLASCIKYGQEVSTVAQALRFGNSDWDNFDALVDECEGVEPEVAQQAIEDAWNNLKEAFSTKTEVDDSRLELYIDYQDPDNGDRYDDVEGVFYTVEGVRDYTPAGKRFAKFIHTANYVVYG